MLFSHVWKVFNNILISFQKYFKNFKKNSWKLYLPIIINVMQWTYKNYTSGHRLPLCSGNLIYLLFNPEGFLGNLSLFARDHQAPQATSDKLSACLVYPLSPAAPL